MGLAAGQEPAVDLGATIAAFGHEAGRPAATFTITGVSELRNREGMVHAR